MVKKKESADGVSMMWFRKGLRLHDNPALLEAIKAEKLFPVFCLDPWFVESKRVGSNRMKFLLESLEDLSESLSKRKSGLLVLKGKPDEVFPKVWKDWGITKLCFEKDFEPYAIERDSKIEQLAKDSGIEVSVHHSHTLFNPEELIEKNEGEAPKSMGQFQSLMSSMGEVPKPVADPPKQFPPLPKDAQTKETEIPTLKELKYAESKSPYRGGESAGLARLSEQLSDKTWVAEFEKPKGNPALFKKPATTCLSPYMKFGCVSARLFYHKIAEILKGHKNHSKPPVSLVGQLYWREWFYTVGHVTPNFDKMEGNPISKQIDWDDNGEFYRAWEDARTGFPWIDAIMTQLRQEGWMHHLARHCVACFLTRGDLYVSWEKGRDTFDRLLVDADYFVNNGNWMWLSASAFFSQFFRVYSPESYGKKYDKSGEYVRHYLPALKDMPDKYIYTPWEAPEAVQKKANCIIGKDYPHPIVDHKEASERCKDRMKAAYDANKRGEMPDGKKIKSPPTSPQKGGSAKKQKKSG